jgi:para-nitrobenzyl esterase
VALAGQSAGAYDTGAHLLSPLSRGLFSRAILMSSPAFTYALPTAEEATAKGLAFAKAAGCPGTDAAAARCLRALSAARILQLAETATGFSPYDTIIPFVDGNVVPLQPETAWGAGKFNKMPILGGSTRDEYSFFAGQAQYYMPWPRRPMTAAEYEAATQPGVFCIWCNGSKMPADVKQQYPLHKFGEDPVAAIDRLNTDTIKCRELHVLSAWAPQVPVYAYDFTYQNAPFYYPQMPGLRIGASHTIDLQFIFDGFHGGNLGVNLDQTTGQPRDLNAEESQLSDAMISAWTRFAATGDPSGEAGAQWPRFIGSAAGRFWVQDVPVGTETVAQFRQEYGCDYWDR